MKTDDTIPQALLDYYERIGAEVVNFRSAMVRTFTGNYYYERAHVRIDTASGDVRVTGDAALKPTKEEAAAIKEAVKSIKWPKPVEATEAEARDYINRCGFSAFEFRSDRSGLIIMLQERKAKADGGKKYIPHTFFNDGVWRAMEPGGALPFWKPKNKTDLGRIMIHEGAKAAAHVTKLIEEKAEHPWIEELSAYEHWGAIGGALAPHRCDYDEIKRRKPYEVIYVCDNDPQGKRALYKVSKAYGGSLKGIQFDDRWPTGWDMADDFPKRGMFSGKRYIGPDLRHMTQPATWATDTVVREKGRPAHIIRTDFSEEWFHAVQPEVFIHRDWPNKIFTGSEFNNRVRPFSDVDDTARLLKTDGTSKGVSLRYSPAARSGLFIEGDQMCLNTHAPTLVKKEKGDVEPFLNFMNQLVINDFDRTELLRWCATLIARPDTKMLYGVLLISEVQGVGKGTLGERILAPLIGLDNTSYPSENEIVEGNFNYWATHKRLAVIHEIYAGHSAKAYNKLKSIITDRFINVNKKYQQAYDIENWLHIFACSNSPRAIQLSSDDRRWFVPKITEQKMSAKYWTELNAWLSGDGGLGKIRAWADDWLKSNAPVIRGEAAPWSEAKREVVEEGFSPGMMAVSQFLDRIVEEKPDQPLIIVDLDLLKLIKMQVYDGRNTTMLERPHTVRKVAKLKKWYVSDNRLTISSWGNSRPYGGRIITNDYALAHRHFSSYMADHLPLDVLAIARAWSDF